MPNNIKDANNNVSLAKAYVSWNDEQSFAKASRELNKGLQNVQPIMKSSAAIANRFQGIDNNTSIRDTYGSLDYEFFRPNEQVPHHFRDIIAACMAAYQKVPIVKQTIDLMGDFTTQGIKLVHSNQQIENFYNEWFRRISGPERSERMANVLYRCGNVIVKRADAKLNASISNNWQKTIADTDLDHTDEPAPGRFEIPFRYTVINPLIVEVLGEHVAAFTGKVHYVLKLPSTFYNTLSLPLTSFDPNILTEGMPRDLQQAMDKNEKYLLLDSDKLILLFYKKDDWDVWAYPILYSLLDEIILMQKMKRADMTALDGVISHIRVWKLGSMEYKIFPTNEAVSKLSSILLNHLAGGAMDLVWGPDLELTNTSTDIANFLGSEKYEFCINQIHTGLGVPAAIGRTKGSMSDNFMSIRVLIERLKYGRNVITNFWKGEIKRVQEAMGFKEPAYVKYDHMVLDDETAEKALWLQLVDRDICTVESVQERFGIIPEIENILLMREYKKRSQGQIPVKTSPYVDPQPDLSLTKVFAQRGMITPSELPNKYDLSLKKPSPDHQDMLDSQFPPPQPPQSPQITQTDTHKKGPDGSVTKTSVVKKPVGVSGEGRPLNSGDTKPRDKRNPKPSSKAGTDNFMSLVNEGLYYQRAISKITDPYFIQLYNRQSLKDLSKTEAIELEKFKFNLLLNMPAYAEDKATIVEDVLNHPIEVYDDIMKNDYQKLCNSFQEKLGKPLNGGDLTMIRAYIYSLLKLQENTNE